MVDEVLLFFFLLLLLVKLGAVAHNPATDLSDSCAACAPKARVMASAAAQ
jgi:hypothetical protein